MPPAITASENPVGKGTAVTYNIAMPAAATGTVTVNGSAASFTQSSALEIDDSGGMKTTLALDPATFPDMTISAWVNITSYTGSGEIVSCFDGSSGGF